MFSQVPYSCLVVTIWEMVWKNYFVSNPSPHKWFILPGPTTKTVKGVVGDLILDGGWPFWEWRGPSQGWLVTVLWMVVAHLGNGGWQSTFCTVFYDHGKLNKQEYIVNWNISQILIQAKCSQFPCGFVNLPWSWKTSLDGSLLAKL